MSGQSLLQRTCLDILQTARKEAEFYINQRKTSAEAAKMIKRVQGDARMKLAAVG